MCVTVAHGTPCLGPVTQAGCGALCPAYARGCYGCFGPQDTPNTASIARRLRVLGMAEPEVVRVFRTFNAAAEPFRRESERHEPPTPRRRADDPQAHRRRPRPARRHPGPGRGRGRDARRVRDGRVTDVQLRIYEPPRFFEAFLRGRAYTEPPDITARICGICPVAYQMSACWAIEDACGVAVPEEIRLMRRLLYCGEWIESHALHVYLLHAPDFLGYDGAIEMAADHPAVVERGLRLKKAGNALMTRGRRPGDPPGQRAGRRLLPVADAAELAARSGRDARARARRRRSTPSAGRRLRLPRLRAAHEYVALRAADGLPASSPAAS